MIDLLICSSSPLPSAGSQCLYPERNQGPRSRRYLRSEAIERNFSGIDMRTSSLNDLGNWTIQETESRGGFWKREVSENAECGDAWKLIIVRQLRPLGSYEDLLVDGLPAAPIGCRLCP